MAPSVTSPASAEDQAAALVVSAGTEVTAADIALADQYDMPLIRCAGRIHARSFLNAFAQAVSLVFDAEHQTEEWLKRMCCGDAYVPAEVMGELRGYRPETRYTCVVAWADGGQGQDRFARDRRLSAVSNLMDLALALDGMRTLRFLTDDGRVACFAPEGDGGDLVERCREALRLGREATGLHWVAAVGTPAASLAQFRESFERAAATAGLTIRLSVGDCVRCYNDWFMHMVLLKRPVPELREHMQGILEPLLGRPELLETLVVHLCYGEQTKRTAEVLGLHAHTVKYRLGRIEELLGCDLGDPTVRFRLRMAVTIQRYLDGPSAPSPVRLAS